MGNIAVYGSAFDPPHLGHMDVVQQLLEKFDQVWLIPSARHAFGKKMSDYAARCEMLNVIVADKFPADSRVKISTIEQEMLQAEPQRKAVFSFDLLSEIQTRQPNDDISLVIGPDNAQPETWQKFYRHKDIERHFLIHIASERLEIRSTQCRKLLAEKTDISRLEPLLGKNLSSWLVRRNLYQA